MQRGLRPPRQAAKLGFCSHQEGAEGAWLPHISPTPVGKKEGGKRNDYFLAGRPADSYEQNKALCRSPAGLWEALRTGAILEARAFLCTQQHDLLVDFSFCQGIIPRQEGALGVADGSVRDIALLSRVGKPVCFVVQSIQQQPDGSIAPVLSRRAAQQRCWQQYLSSLLPGQVIPARVTIWSRSAPLSISAAACRR